MASRALTLTLYRSLSCSKQAITSITRSYTSTSSIATTSYFSSPPSFLLRVRPLTAIAHNIHGFFPACSGPGSYRGLSTRQTQSSLNDSSPNWSKRPPNETILLDGCDFEHWLVVLEKPDDTMTRDEIIDMYIETLAQVVGSKEEARMKIYSVSTKHYFAFGALVPEELSNKLKEIPKVRWVLPDSYLDVKNKDYGGEPFINGQAVPYDPKYHEEWVRNNAKAMERNRRNDRPRNFDRSRNFERRRQNMQNPPMNMGGQMPPPNNMGGQMPPPNNMGGQMPPPNNMGGQMPPPNNMGGQMPPPNNMGGQMPPPNNMGGQMPPPNNMGGQMPHQSNMGGQMPYQSNMGGQMPHQSNMGRQMPPQNNPGGGMPPNMVGRGPMGGEMPPNMGGPGSMRGGMPPNTGSPGSMGGGMHPNMSGGPPGNMGSGSPVGGAPNVGGYLNSGWQGQGGNMPNYQGGGSGYPQHHPGVGQHQQGNYGAHGENPYNQGQRDMPPPPPPNYRQ